MTNSAQAAGGRGVEMELERAGGTVIPQRSRSRVWTFVVGAELAVQSQQRRWDDATRHPQLQPALCPVTEQPGPGTETRWVWGQRPLTLKQYN